MAKYSFGTPEENDAVYEELISTFDEVPGHWHIGKRYSRLTAEEFEESYRHVEKILLKYGRVGYESTDDLYLDDRFMGDRTHSVEVIDESKMREGCLNELQLLLCELHPLWRILVSFTSEKRNDNLHPS